ncbi:tRNA pseudouridine(38-40) synthase TruA [ANME-1 cluster archaeon AG-394-G21]|nr:tRNA pseudouridine(38-40) synthase TruA [ANME-1 cluster archaeon AG-394-G21]
MREEAERIALKIGYLGTNYHGFQIQPQAELQTVEGELFKALKRLGILEDRKTANYSYAGRTDKGVHALAQVVSFDTLNLNVTPRMINSMLPNDIWALAMAKPHAGFNARKEAISREYRYFLFLQTELDISRMRDASELLIGAHDFSNFSQRDGLEGKSLIKGIKQVDIVQFDPFIIIDIAASGFLRKMVREIVSALSMVGSGKRAKSWIQDLLDLKIKEQIEPAPAFGLVLKDVSYHELEFVVDEYAKRRITARLKKDLLIHATMAKVLSDMIDI